MKETEGLCHELIIKLETGSLDAHRKANKKTVIYGILDMLRLGKLHDQEVIRQMLSKVSADM